MSKMVWQPELFSIEDRGYNRGVGHAILPSGQVIAVHHEQDEWSAEVIRRVYSAYLCGDEEP